MLNSKRLGINWLQLKKKLETANWKLKDVMKELDGTKEEKINAIKREGAKR
jgi:hypothetical protein